MLVVCSGDGGGTRWAHGNREAKPTTTFILVVYAIRRLEIKTTGRTIKAMSSTSFKISTAVHRESCSSSQLHIRLIGASLELGTHHRAFVADP